MRNIYTPYHKINSVYKRDPATNYKTFLPELTLPEFGLIDDWHASEKLDGTNFRIIFDGHGVDFRGRSDNAQLPCDLLSFAAATFKPEMFESHPIVLFGEGVGPGIQKVGHMYGPSKRVVLFDAWCGMWLKRTDVVDIAKTFGVESAAQWGCDTLERWVELAARLDSSGHGDGPAEGFVLRPEGDFLTRRGERIITKVKTRDFAND